MSNQEVENQQDEIINLLEAKFTNGCTEVQKKFWEEIKRRRDKHKELAEGNKENYFNKNTLLISLLSSKKLIKIIVVFWGTIVAAIGIKDVIIMCLAFFNIILPDAKLTSMVLILMFIIYVGLIYFTYNLYEKQKELQLRRYGETWIRHKVALFYYDEEILKYACALDCYNGQTEEQQRIIFMNNILLVEEKNMNKFDENMKKLQEYVN